MLSVYCRCYEVPTIFSLPQGVPSAALREICLLKELKHKNIVRWGCKQDDWCHGLPNLFLTLALFAGPTQRLITQFTPGESLGARLYLASSPAPSPLPEERPGTHCLRMCKQCVPGLSLGGRDLGTRLGCTNPIPLHYMLNLILGYRLMDVLHRNLKLTMVFEYCDQVGFVVDFMMHSLWVLFTRIFSHRVTLYKLYSVILWCTRIRWCVL